MKKPEFIKKMDWTLLREQKDDLLQVITDTRLKAERYRSNGEHKGAAKVDREADSLEGILNLVDAVQDYAVDRMKIDANIVFGFDRMDKIIVTVNGGVAECNDPRVKIIDFDNEQSKR